MADVISEALNSFFNGHSLVCPCGATCNTPSAEIASEFIKAHKEHSRGTTR